MRKSVFLLAISLIAFATCARASIVINTVPIGNPGNSGEQSRLEGFGDERYYGSVDYTYNMGRCEITAAQYAEFLNAVAASDPYQLYRSSMSNVNSGCGIARSGSPGNYSYAVLAGCHNRPANYIKWPNAARFANWMHNGQGSGDTETGSYTLNGGMLNSELQYVTREPGATWVIPNDNEWYKAAYHKNDGVTGNYFDYPTSSDTVDYSMANYDMSVGQTAVIGSYPYPSPYGTYDQGGNAWEWTETIPFGIVRGLRGGGFTGVAGSMAATNRAGGTDSSCSHHGFRLAYVPEPGTLALLVLGGLAVMRRR